MRKTKKSNQAYNNCLKLIEYQHLLLTHALPTPTFDACVSSEKGVITVDVTINNYGITGPAVSEHIPLCLTPKGHSSGLTGFRNISSRYLHVQKVLFI